MRRGRASTNLSGWCSVCCAAALVFFGMLASTCHAAGVPTGQTAPLPTCQCPTCEPLHRAWSKVPVRVYIMTAARHNSTHLQPRRQVAACPAPASQPRWSAICRGFPPPLSPPPAPASPCPAPCLRAWRGGWSRRLRRRRRRRIGRGQALTLPNARKKQQAYHRGQI